MAVEIIGIIAGIIGFVFISICSIYLFKLFKKVSIVPRNSNWLRDDITTNGGKLKLKLKRK
jgi:hypothetical protein